MSINDLVFKSLRFKITFLMQEKRAKLSLGWTHFHSVISFNDLHAPPAHVCNAFCPFRGFYYSGLSFFTGILAWDAQIQELQPT